MCDGVNPDLGHPFVVEVLGQVLHFPYLGERVGLPAHISQGALPLADRLDVGGVPVVAVVGTCMNAGKTQAACSLIQAFAHRGLKVAAGKATGVSLRRDVLAMEDAGRAPHAHLHRPRRGDHDGRGRAAGGADDPHAPRGRRART